MAAPSSTGTATSGASVKVEIHSDPIVLSTAADGSVIWSVTPAQDIPNNEHSAIIIATNEGAPTSLDAYVLGINTGLAATGMPVWPLALVAIGAVVAAHLTLRRHRLVQLFVVLTGLNSRSDPPDCESHSCLA
jgi:hypothetical protein